jgi:hypothetical protein
MNLSSSAHSSYSISLRPLKEKKLVVTEERELHNFDECVKHYPGKTLSGKVRALPHK